MCVFVLCVGSRNTPPLSLRPTRHEICTPRRTLFTRDRKNKEKIKTHLGVHFGSRRNHSVALSLPEWRLVIRLEDDVARLTRRLGSDDALARLHLDDERLLGRPGVERHLLGLLELERHLGELSGRRRDGGDRDGLGHGRAARRVDL